MRKTYWIVASLLASAMAAGAQQPDLTNLSVDDLMNIEVTSVARKAQKLSETAAAVFVITQDDIRRSGATSIPEALRMVPGVDVAQVNASTWAITARGFNGRFANKLLVLIDGRTVYDTLNGGVFWDVQDTLLEDVEHIEVIRGPGGTLWGANALNGVINIITKHSVDTQGALVSAGGGTNERGFVGARYGGSLGPNGSYRAWAKTFDRASSVNETGISATDSWNFARTGMRADWSTKHGDTFMVQSEAYRGNSSEMQGLVDPGHPFAGPRLQHNELQGAHALFRWSATQSKRSDTELQVFYDYTDRQQVSLNETRHVFDVDFQHAIAAGRHAAMWGVAYRMSIDDTNSDVRMISLFPQRTAESLFSAFIQDEIKLSKRMRVTLGSKVQYEKVSRFQFQPSLRILYQANERNMIWGAVTNAVKTPSRFELASRLYLGAFPTAGGDVGFLVLDGNPDLKPERLVSYELGYRWQPHPTFSLDAATFMNDLRRIAGYEAREPYQDGDGTPIVPIQFDNTVHGRSAGAELFATYDPQTRWNLSLGYSRFAVRVKDDEGRSNSTEIGQIATPKYVARVRSSLALSPTLDLDGTLFYVGRLEDPTMLSSIPAYLRVDARIGWRPVPRFEVSVVGQNLTRSRHREFGAADSTGAETWVQRSIYAKVTWRF